MYECPAILPHQTEIPESLKESTFHALDLLPFCTKPLNSQKQKQIFTARQGRNVTGYFIFKWIATSPLYRELFSLAFCLQSRGAEICYDIPQSTTF